MKRGFPWNILGIDQTHDRAAIRKAYADVLRGIDVDSDIAGYAELRRARDQALWLATQADRADEDDFGLGGFDDLPGDARTLAPPPPPSPSQSPSPPPSRSPTPTPPPIHQDWTDVPDEDQPEPPDDAPPAPRLGDDKRDAQAAWRSLLDILYPEGELSEESVTYAEMEEGQAQLALLLAHAEEADLVEHDALDHALANLFADTWPRSAPFVEPANAAFHWLGEAGQLEERHALKFLNARLKGMRFHEKVQQPDHPLHKAWVELSRAGRATLVDRLKVNRLEIDKLLTGLRMHYPELESYLAPERVLSWEGRTNSSGVSDTGPNVVRGIFIAVILLLAIRFAVNLIDPRPDNPSIPAPSVFDALPSAQEADAAVADIFGQGTGMDVVRAADPVFVDQLRLALNKTGFDQNAPLSLVRRKALEAGEVAGFEQLLARARLRRLWLGAAARQGSGVCQNVMNYDFSTLPLELTDAERSRERPLLRQLLGAKVLNHDAQGGMKQFTIPGWAVSDMIKRSGLGEDAVRAAMRDTANPDRCTVEIALMDVVPDNAARVSADLLRGL